MKLNLKQKFVISTTIAIAIALTLFNKTVQSLGLNQGDTVAGGIGPDAGRFIGAGLAVGLAGFGASIGMGNASSAAIGAISEDQSLFGTALIFVVLIEAVAIYGLLIALLLIFAA